MLTTTQTLVIPALIISHWLMVWLGMDMERTKNRYKLDMQYKLDRERAKRDEQ